MSGSDGNLPDAVESRVLEQSDVAGEAALTAAQEMEHQDVHGGGPARNGRIGHHGFDEQEFGSDGSGPADCGENLPGVAVVPIVDDLHEDVRIGAGQIAVEEIAWAKFETLACDVRGLGDDVGLIEEDALAGGGLLEDGFEKVPSPAADVRDDGKAAEIVRPGNEIDHHGGFGLHAGVESSVVFGVLLQIGPEAAREDGISIRQAGRDGFVHAHGCLPEDGHAEHAQKGSHGRGVIGGQEAGELGVAELALGVLEDVVGAEEREHSGERVGMGVSEGGQVRA